MSPVRKPAAVSGWVSRSIALPCLLYSMDLTVLNLALPHISADLRPSSAQLLWMVDIDLAGSACTTALEFAAIASAGLVLVTAFLMVVLAGRSQSPRRAAGQCAVCGA